MRTIFFLLFLLCASTVEIFGQGVAVRAQDGRATNITVNGLNPTNPAVIYLRTNGLDTIARAGDITRAWGTWSNAVGALRSGYTLDVGDGSHQAIAMVGAASGGSILINKSNITIRGQGPSSRITWTNHGNIVWGTNLQNIRISDLAFYGPSNHNSASFSAGATENEGVFYIVGSGTNFASSNLFFSRIYGYNIPDFFFLDFTDARNIDNVTMEDSYFENVGWTNAAWLGQPDGGVMFVHRRAKIRNVTTAGLVTQAIETDTGAFSFPGERDANIDIEGCYFGGLYHRGVSVYYGTGGYIQQYIRIANTIFEGGNVMAPVSRQMAYIGTGKRVDISNCEFRHWPLLDAAHGAPIGIQIQPNLTNMTDVKIRNCIFTEVYTPVVVIEGNGYNVTNFIASDNVMNDIGLDGFQCYGGDGLKFLRNTIINFGTNAANRAMVYLYQDATFTNSCTDVELIGNSASDTKGTPTGGYLFRTTGTHSRLRFGNNRTFNLANAEPLSIDTVATWSQVDLGAALPAWVTLPASLHFGGVNMRQRTNAVSGSRAIILTNLLEGVSYRFDVDATGGDGTTVITFTGHSGYGAALTNGLTSYLIEKIGTQTNINRIVPETQINFSTGFAAITNNQTTVTVTSTAGGLPTGGFGEQLMHDGTDPFWVSLSTAWVIKDEFMEYAATDPVGELNWRKGGTLAVSTQAEFGDGTHWGVLRLRSSSVADGLIYVSPDSIVLGSSTSILEWIIRPLVASDGTDTYTLLIGLGDSLSGLAQTDGVYFRYTHSVNSGNWECVSETNTTETVSSTGSAFLTAWTRLGIKIEGASRAVFYTNGVAMATNTSNIPVGAGRALGPTAVVSRSAGTANRDFYIDAFRMFSKPATVR